ncbi:SIMPL domain-containing protein [uncultured Rubinisphaera sp.]|uniref:SIMPL domain-containing protein n=1 Tax=uncultured Rubinisphaera sp. TaxID=1678686 RepID=UPI0030D78489
MDTLHLITVCETSASDVNASAAKLAVRIAGQSFFTGNEAFKKAAEVASLVSVLKELGISEDDIHLLNVSTEVESGILTKTSSATYHLLINCQSIDLLGRVLAAISSQKNSKLAAISWQYPDLEKTKRDLVQNAVRAAKDAARAVADSLAVPLLGVHKLSYDISGLDTELRVPEVSGFAMRRSKAMATPLDSLDLSHSTTIVVTVTAEFMVDTFTHNDK